MIELLATPEGEMKPAFFKTPYNHDRNAESDRTAQVNLEPTRTQQHHAAEADINNIVKNFGITGKLPSVPVPPTYADFADVFDFQSAMNVIKNANDSFMALPAETRATFNNDPARFVGYVDHCLETGDLDPLRDMGLALPRKPHVDPEPPKPATGGSPAPEPAKGAPEGPKS